MIFKRKYNSSTWKMQTSERIPLHRTHISDMLRLVSRFSVCHCFCHAVGTYFLFNLLARRTSHQIAGYLIRYLQLLKVFGLNLFC